MAYLQPATSICISSKTTNQFPSFKQKKTMKENISVKYIKTIYANPDKPNNIKQKIKSGLQVVRGNFVTKLCGSRISSENFFLFKSVQIRLYITLKFLSNQTIAIVNLQSSIQLPLYPSLLAETWPQHHSVLLSNIIILPPSGNLLRQQTQMIEHSLLLHFLINT